MIQLNAAGKRYGHKLLFDGVDLLITPRDRMGLVGANGTGKSTLLKVLGGFESLDYGNVSVAKGLTFGYLPQDGLSLSGRTSGSSTWASLPSPSALASSTWASVSSISARVSVNRRPTCSCSKSCRSSTSVKS